MGLMRDDGIMLPANGAPLSGSKMVLEIPEKSPARSADVGRDETWL